MSMPLDGVGNYYDNKLDRDVANWTGKRPDGSYIWEPSPPVNRPSSSGDHGPREGKRPSLLHGDSANRLESRDGRAFWEQATELLTFLLIMAGGTLGAYAGFTETSRGMLTLGAALAGGAIGALLGVTVQHCIRVLIRFKGWILPLFFLIIAVGRCAHLTDRPEVPSVAHSASGIVDISR